MTFDLFPSGEAILSKCGLYRYNLSRRWSDGKTCVFVMLNPSTADASSDDPTIRRCIGFARREGCGGLVVVNLFALRATQPLALLAEKDPIGPMNDEFLIDAIVNSSGPAIAAWGAHGTFMDRADTVRRMTDKPLWALGVTKAGQPRHPLYVRGDAPLIPY